MRPGIFQGLNFSMGHLVHKTFGLGQKMAWVKEKRLGSKNGTGLKYLFNPTLYQTLSSIKYDQSLLILPVKFN